MKTETKEKENQDLVKVGPTHSERFTNMVVREFSSNGNTIELSNFQKKLCQNYFIKVDTTLKEAEAKRLKKSEQYRDSLSLVWENVNMSKLAIDVIAYSSVGLDPIQQNHINLIPYKNSNTDKYDFGFVIGYKGTEIKSVKYGLDVPDVVTVELVRKNDNFKEIKKDANNKVESYIFEIVDSFDRGDIVGGFYFHQFQSNPEKNKIKTFTLYDIEKRKPKYASVEFWGGEKDEWKNGKKTGQKTKVEGWFEEMAYKTIYRAAYNSITIDSEKIDENYLAIIEKERTFNDDKVQNEIEKNANKQTLDIDIEDAEIIEETKVEPIPKEQQELGMEDEMAGESKQEQENKVVNPGPQF